MASQFWAARSCSPKKAKATGEARDKGENSRAADPRSPTRRLPTIFKGLQALLSPTTHGAIAQGPPEHKGSSGGGAFGKHHDAGARPETKDSSSSELKGDGARETGHDSQRVHGGKG